MSLTALELSVQDYSTVGVIDIACGSLPTTAIYAAGTVALATLEFSSDGPVGTSTQTTVAWQLVDIDDVCIAGHADSICTDPGTNALGTISVTSITPTFTITPTPTSTPAPPPTPTDPTLLTMDADPTNGTRPCDPIDVVRTVATGDMYDVAVCYIGNPSSVQLTVDYDSLINNATDNGGSPSENLDGNPNLNDGAGTGQVGVDWDCTLGGLDPPSGGDPATLKCAGTGTLALDPGHVATIEFQATGSGTELVQFVAAGTIVDGESCFPVGTRGCGNVTINKVPPPPTVCPLTLSGTLGETSPGFYEARQGRSILATGVIPAGKNNLTLRVRDASGVLVAQQSFSGTPGQQFTLGFTAFVPFPPGAMGVECLVDNVVESTAALLVRLIDPSGRVFNIASGASIVGASVELQIDSDTGLFQAWVPMNVTTHAGYFTPALNPETTGLDGRYAWDVSPFYPPLAVNDFRVVVSAPGCFPATSAIVGVPPPALDLDVGLFCADSDGDGLTNTDESGRVGTNPASADTDGDGTTDGAEDADGDGLSNLVEISAATDPLDADTDGDALMDGVEGTHGTSPLVADTDIDKCNDGQEVANQGVKEPDDPLDRRDYPNFDGDSRVDFDDFMYFAARYATTNPIADL